MSAPDDRLLGDAAAELFGCEAASILAGPETLPTLRGLAAAVVLLIRDRQARQELAAFCKGS